MQKKIRMSSVNRQNSVFDMNYITYQQSKLYQKGKNQFKSFNRTMSGFMSHHSQRINKDYAMNRNIISPMINSAFNRNNLMKNSNSNINLNLNININDENFSKIKKLWNELCVSPSYRELFIIIYNQLTGDEKEQFFNKEFSELISIKTDIKTLNFYIDQRNKVLKELYEENTKLNSNKYDKNSLIIEISNLIEKLRESTIDVCLAMKKFKNGVNNVSCLAKYNMDILARKSNFDKNYLIKMKGELSFLKEGNAKFCFNLSDDRSPFLLKTSEANINMINNNNNNDKDFFIRIVPLKEETKELISECNYYIYQELIAYQQNILAQKKIFRCVSPLKNSPIMDNKDNTIRGNTLKSDSNLNLKINRDFTDMTSLKSFNNNNIFGEKSNKNVQKFINQRFSAPPTKDLFSQKLFSGYNFPGELPSNFPLEEEKVKDEEEEEEFEEKSENDTNELNELAEEKKNESENINDINKDISGEDKIESNKDNSGNDKVNENNEYNSSGKEKINEEKEDNSNEDNKDNNEETNSYKNNSANQDEKINKDDKDNTKEIEKNLGDDANNNVNLQKEDENNKDENSNQEKKISNNPENKSEEKNNTEKQNDNDDNKKLDKDNKNVDKDNKNVDKDNKKNEEEESNTNNINEIKIQEKEKK